MARTCFVIAPFNNDVFMSAQRSAKIMQYAVYPALKKCEYEIIRADHISAPGLITDQIIARLISSDLTIADLTGHEPTVFYELGIRHALGKPVIHIIDSSESILFDLSKMRTVLIDYDDIESIFLAKNLIIKTIKEYDEGLAYESIIESMARHIHAREPQSFQVNAYLGEFSQEQQQKLKEALDLIQSALNLSIDQDIPAQEGSWFKRWIMKTNETLSRPEISERLRKIELAVETEILKKPQALVDVTLAKAAQALLSSLENTNNAAIQIGSLLIVKRTDSDGESVVVARNLTIREVQLLESQPTILQDPTQILNLLERNKPASNRAVLEGDIQV